jgi:hypothetical protein
MYTQTGMAIEHIRRYGLRNNHVQQSQFYRYAIVDNMICNAWIYVFYTFYICI